MRQLPSGTVTFLFTDIEGSTRLLEALGAEAYAKALAEHRRVMREAIAAHDGVEVDTQGDAFFVAFASAEGALEAASRAQAALAAEPVRVRMGIHSGHPLVAAEGYVGMDVHQGARVMSAGHGGQVLVSEATRGLVDSNGRLVDLGLHRLKDLTAPQRLWQLGGGEFPPLKTLYQTNLPVQPTALVGRERELAEVLELLRQERLVTLTGAGGSGKTRLALQAAAELADEFKDGVWWISLGALRDPDLMEPTIAHVVGAKDLREDLRRKETLLLLDNFEQIVDAAPQIAELLAVAPSLRVLATSRERLAVAAEHEYLVPMMEQSEAVALFTARARQVHPDFHANAAVGEICRRLDGLPLAIELAAARVKLLEPGDILDRLGRSLDVLTSRRRDAPARQQTLRATVEWSYELLSVEEQRAFESLAIFPGSFSIDAAEDVCATDLNTLEALVDKSLVRRTDAGRFFLLETIRAFAVERSSRSGALDDARRRHLDFFHHLVDEIGRALARRQDAETVSRLDVERENIRAAISEAEALDEYNRMGEMLAWVASRWIWVGSGEEASKWLTVALERVSSDRADLTAALYAGLGDLALARTDWDETDRLHLKALEVVPEADVRRRTMSLIRLAQSALMRGDYPVARDRAAEAAAVARSGGYQRGEVVAKSTLGGVALYEREYGRARDLLLGAAEGFHKLGEDSDLALVLANLAYAELREHDDQAARATTKQMFSILMRTRDEFMLAHSVELLAALLLRARQLAVAAQVLAVGESARDEHGWELQPLEQELHDELVAALDAAGMPVDMPAVLTVSLHDAVSAGLAALD